jgi:flavin reductase (DIM6/NTAB) family NADH-FMN oxidoreductase RutF
MRASHSADIQDLDVPAAFRQSMSLMASAVAVVTTRVEGRPWGMTITACCSVSATPPMILVSLLSTTVSALGIRTNGEYGLSLLGSRAIDVAKFGAAPGAPKFLDDGNWLSIQGAGSTPCVRGSLTHLDCEVVDELVAADHSIFVGRVRSVAFPVEDHPLVYCHRQYHRVVPALELVRSGEDDHAQVYSAW